MVFKEQLKLETLAILAAIALAVLLAFTPIKAAQAHQKSPMPPPERIITLVKENLASCLKVSPDEINAAPVIPVIWNDSSLGVPKPGHYYLQVLIPGYIILLEHNHTIYRYTSEIHSWMGVRMALVIDRTAGDLSATPNQTDTETHIK